MTILLTVAYDGTNYAGWQRQNNAVTVQQKIEEALSSFFNQPIKTTASSRTDAGVHALSQQVAFEVDNLIIPPNKINKLAVIINSLLPDDIAIQAAKIAESGFNPRFCAKAKTYCYQIYNDRYPNPLLNRYSALEVRTLDVQKMAESALYFTGTHNFVAFCASGSNAKTTIRTISACEVTQDKRLIKITVTGDGFLYNMVRIIAGTILYVGIGKLQPSDIPTIIASGDRTRAGKTMPPEGLTLVEVIYGD